MVKAFYQSAHYEPIRDRAVSRAKPGDGVKLSDRIPSIRTLMLDYFEERSFERMGRLHGEYLVHPAGVLLVDRDGFVTASCVSLEDPSMNGWLADGAEQMETNDFVAMRRFGWDAIESARGLPVLCDPYDKNYYHFTLELAPRARFFPSLRYEPFVTSKTAVTRPFQVDLMQRCAPSPYCCVMDRFIRIRDPLVSHDVMSEEGVAWLRGASNIVANSGRRRLYLRRSGRGTRSEDGGGVSESPAFLAQLRERGFEIVEFGNGELTASAQAALLEGAGLIVAAHGAALSNLVYLRGEVGVVEVIGPRTCRAMFMHLSSMLGFRYYGLVSGDYDENGDIVVDPDEFAEALRFVA